MKKFSLGMLLATTTSIFGGFSDFYQNDNSIETVEVEQNDSEYKILKTTYYDSSIFRYLSVDNPYWELTNLDTSTIEVAKNILLTENNLSADLIEKNEDELNNELVDNLDSSNSGSSKPSNQR